MFEGTNRSFDQAPCLELSVTESDIAQLCESMTAVARANAKPDGIKIKPVQAQQLLSWGIIIRRSGGFVPTNAYAILTGSDVIRSVVQCGVFKGTTKAVFVDRRELSGAPQELIEQTYQYVLRNIHMGVEFSGVHRQDVYEIPPDAIRELIVNALVHRSYLDHSSVQVAIYDNRLEVTSPGRLPISQTVERMKQGYSKVRNEALAAAFAYMGYIEHWGSGIPRIIEEVRAAGLREPEFLGGDVDLRINIYRPVRDADLSTDGLDETDQRGVLPEDSQSVRNQFAISSRCAGLDRFTTACVEVYPRTRRGYIARCCWSSSGREAPGSEGAH